MNEIKKILLTPEGRKFYVKDLKADFHTQFGFIKKADLKKKDGTIILTNTGKEMVLFKPVFIDSYRRIKRDPQIIPLKDIAAIIAETGVDKTSLVVDAGAGSGALCCFLANIAKKVVTYELREDFSQTCRFNIEMLGLKNITLKRKSIYDGIDEKNVDLITFDLPEPWMALEHAKKALKIGGFLVSYSPTIPQVADFVNAAEKIEGLMHIKTIEIIEREWEVKDRKVRPRSQMIGHTGFLSFLRRIK